jgi:hypothetical protein
MIRDTKISGCRVTARPEAVATASAGAEAGTDRSQRRLDPHPPDAASTRSGQQDRQLYGPARSRLAGFSGQHGGGARGDLGAATMRNLASFSSSGSATRHPVQRAHGRATPFATLQAFGLEGIVSKRKDSKDRPIPAPTAPGQRRTPAGKGVVSVMGAEFERPMIAERVRAGLAWADGRVASPAKSRHACGSRRSCCMRRLITEIESRCQIH